MILVKQSGDMVSRLSFNDDEYQIIYQWELLVDDYDKGFGNIVFIGNQGCVFENAVSLRYDKLFLNVDIGYRQPGRVYCAACESYKHVHVIEQSNDKRLLKDFSLVVVDNDETFERKECHFSSFPNSSMVKKIRMTREGDYIFNDSYVMSRNGGDVIDIWGLLPKNKRMSRVSVEETLDSWGINRTHKLRTIKELSLIKLSADYYEYAPDNEIWLAFKVSAFSQESSCSSVIPIGASLLTEAFLVDITCGAVEECVDIRKDKKDNLYLLSS